MRVANIIEEGKLGGPQVRMVRVAAAMASQADTLIIMPQTNSDSFRGMCENYGVSYRTMSITRITKEWRVAIAYVFLSPWEILQLARLLRSSKVDLVHASGGSWQYKAVLAARLARVPSVWHLNDTDMPRWVLRLFSLVQPLATGFIFASHRTQNYYRKFLSNRVEAIVPSTVDMTRFDPSLEYPIGNQISKTSSMTQVIGTVANINRIKGLEVLIEAFALVRRRTPNLRLLIVGPVYDSQKRYFKEITALAENLGVVHEIEWIGAKDDVRPFLAQMDVYVCSSLAESSPVSVWEAMAMALPVVSTDVGDVARHVVDGHNGYVVPVGDAEALATCIGSLILDSEARLQMGAAARDAVEFFAPSSIAAKTFEIYRQVVGSWIASKATSTSE